MPVDDRDAGSAFARDRQTRRAHIEEIAEAWLDRFDRAVQWLSRARSGRLAPEARMVAVPESPHVGIEPLHLQPGFGKVAPDLRGAERTSQAGVAVRQQQPPHSRASWQTEHPALRREIGR